MGKYCIRSFDHHQGFCWIVLLFVITGCTPPPVPYNPNAPVPTTVSTEVVPPPPARIAYEWETDPAYTLPGPMPKPLGDNEGSLWENASSWGNLLRDQRAAFDGDLLQVTGVSGLVNPNNLHPTLLENEIASVQKNLKEITAHVVKVMPNGLLAIQGEKVEYREGDFIRFRTTLRGFIRPQDLTKQNEVDAKKIFMPEFVTSKAYKADQLPAGYELDASYRPVPPGMGQIGAEGFNLSLPSEMVSTMAIPNQSTQTDSPNPPVEADALPSAQQPSNPQVPSNSEDKAAANPAPPKPTQERLPPTIAKPEQNIQNPP